MQQLVYLRPVFFGHAARFCFVVAYGHSLCAQPRMFHQRFGRDAVKLCGKLCERAVDYLSTGYFRIFGNLLSPQAWLDSRAYASFEATTTTVLGFNDGYAKPGPVPHTRFKNALAELALVLETRFELEDRLFARLRSASTVATRRARVRPAAHHAAFAAT